ncbi:MAG: ribonuclease R [Clostridiales bacterium]|nr:ribonuclease R [Clostridiales bacterium]
MITEEKKTYADIEPKGPLGVKNTVVGVLTEGTTCAWVIPDGAFKESRLGRIRIDKNHINGAPFKMTVVCEILNPEDDPGSYRGNIVEVLGDMGNNDVRMMSVIRQFGLSTEFPKPVLDEISDLGVNPDPEVIEDSIRKGRHDLRDLLTITIDGEEAKDLDDAISIEKTDDGYKLYVHIADVSDYVRENTLLDGEAMLRGNSVYLSDRVIPMLPPKLSNGLCSLNPKVDRLTLTAEMNVDLNGITKSGDVYESVIRSDARMSYNECFRILTEPKDSDKDEYGPIVPMLHEMEDLYERLKVMRERKGAVNFDLPETKVILDDDGNPTDIMPYPITFCNGIIEQFMICANEFIAEKFAKLNWPFVYRVHEDPDPIKIGRFCKVARNYGAVGRLSSNPSPLEISLYKQTIKDEDAGPMLDSVLLRSMAKARYSSDCLGHYGLASKFYCHFTSPIRRYPDLYIHRIIKSWLHGENKRKHFAGKVAGVADHSSVMEQNSVDAERVSVDVKVAQYMKDKIGEKYQGVITSIIQSGLFVMIPNSAEGFIPFSTLRDHYVFDEQKYLAYGTRSGNKLMIGQKVDIVVSAVDTDLLHIDFIMENEDFERKPGMPGRRARATAKKKKEKITRRRKR